MGTLLAAILLLCAHLGGPGCLECDEDGHVPKAMKPAYEQARGNVIQIHATFRDRDDEGERRVRQLSGVGVLFDPAQGDVITDRRLVEGAERVSAWFVGHEALLPRRALLLGCDEESGFAVVRTGPVDVDCIAMPAALVADQHGQQRDALLLSYHVEDQRLRATSGKLGCVVDEDAPGGRRGILTHEPDEHLAPGGLVAAATDGRPLGWIEAAPFPSTRDARLARAALAASGEPQQLHVLPMLGVAQAFERIVCAHAAAPRVGPKGPGRVWLGITADRVKDDDALRHQLGLEGPAIVIHDVFHDSPAFHAGLRPHHVIVSLAGAPLESHWALYQHLRQSEVGDEFELGVIRGGKLVKLEVTLGVW